MPDLRLSVSGNEILGANVQELRLIGIKSTRRASTELKLLRAELDKRIAALDNEADLQERIYHTWEEV